jgi:hypothetical protein
MYIGNYKKAIKELNKWIRFNWVIDFEMWGIGILIFKNSEIGRYKYSLDFQLLFINCWIEILKKNL